MDRMTASPRKTCVPGVHACATAGATISASTANTAPRATQPNPNRVRRVTLRPAAGLQPKTFPLATDGAPEHFELRLDRVVDRLERTSDVVRDMLSNLVAGNAVPKVLAAVGGPARAARAETERMLAGPSSASRHPEHDRCSGTPAGRPAPEHEGQTGADRRSDQRGGE